MARGVVPVYAEPGIVKANEQFGVEIDASDAEPGVLKADEEEDGIIQAAHIKSNTEYNILHFGCEVDALSGVGIEHFGAEADAVGV